MLTKPILGPREIRTHEILPDVWMLEGYISDNFFLKPPSSNCYLLRDDDTLYLVDPGTYRIYQEKVLELVEAYRLRGVKRIRLLVTQGHFDHSSNDDVLRRTGLEWEFYLPEVEVPIMDATADFMRDIEELGRYENVFETMFAGTSMSAVFGGVARVSPAAARAMLRTLASTTMGSNTGLVNRATLLRSDQKVSRTFGSVTLSGWNLGRFFLIHDGSHTPGHICVYDPRNKLVLTGDTTIEINPAFLYSSMNKLVAITADLAAMAGEGAIEYVADGHRSAKYFGELARRLRMPTVDDLQLIDFARGSEQSAAFLTFYSTYYSELISEVRLAHARAGRSTVGEIVDEFHRSTNRYARFKISMVFPGLPSRDDLLVAQVLKEAGATPIDVDNEIRFDPVL